MKKKCIKYLSAFAACIIAMLSFATYFAPAPVVAEAWHLDFWNDYEDGCTVVYEQVNAYGYKVVVMSEDKHRFWTNNTPSVPYWYPTSYLASMIGYNPDLSGYTTCDIRTEVLNNSSYFARFSC